MEKITLSFYSCLSLRRFDLIFQIRVAHKYKILYCEDIPVRVLQANSRIVLGYTTRLRVAEARAKKEVNSRSPPGSSCLSIMRKSFIAAKKGSLFMVFQILPSAEHRGIEKGASG